jgi:hypothetical protein
MKSIIITFILLTFVTTSNSFAQNHVLNNNNSKWGYYLQIIDTNYIPTIASKNELGYVTLHTSITEYDAVFAKYKITDFFQYAPTSATDWLRQVYVLVCDSGQTQLGVDLQEKYSSVIAKIEYYYHNPILTDELTNNIQRFGQKGNILWLGETNGLNKTVYFFDMNGKIIFSTSTPNESINPSSMLGNGFYVYKIKDGENIKRGLYYKP